MPTNSLTGDRYFWYVRNKGANHYIGIVDDTGTAISTSGLDIDVFFQSWPDEISSDNDQIGLPSEFMHALAKAVASEIIKMNGGITALTQQYDLIFERAVYDGTHLAIDNAKQPMTQYPINLRNL